MPISMHYVDPV